MSLSDKSGQSANDPFGAIVSVGNEGVIYLTATVRGRTGRFLRGINMRKLLMIAAPLALVACAEEPVVEEEVVEVATADTATTANGSPVGTVSVTTADGEPAGTSNLNADGTYQDFAADGSLSAEGTWAVVEGKTCFTPTTEGADDMCWTESEAAEDGSFTATPDVGDPVTVSPMVADEEA